MLPRVHRLVDGADLRRVSRRGQRFSTAYFVVSMVPSDAPTRVGFVVSKQVGGAVTRNKVKRRLREIAQRWLISVPFGGDIVVRASPASATAPYSALSAAWDGVWRS